MLETKDAKSNPVVKIVIEKRDFLYIKQGSKIYGVQFDILK